MASQLLRLLLISATVLVWTAAEADSSGRASVEVAPLADHERRQITLDLLDQYPELASSPGIKQAVAPVDRDGRIGIRVIFHPHAESHGIKEAYTASCAWEHLSHTWNCYAVEDRKYLTLPSQDFEVRVIGDIPADAAFAIIDASRRDLERILSEDPDRPDTATVIRRNKEDFGIAWATEDGATSLGMIVQLLEDGDPTISGDWHAYID